MANDVPSTWPSPDPAVFAPMSAIYATEGLTLGQAQNSLKARAILLAQQGWHPSVVPTDGAPFARSPAAWSADPQAIYRVPAIAWRSNVSLVAYCVGPGGGGQIRIRSATNGNTLTTAVPAGGSWVAPVGTLLGGWGAGYDDVEVYTQGDGSDPTVVEHLALEMVPSTSPLAAPSSSDPVVPIDTDEGADDEPLSSDEGRAIRSGLEAYLARKSRLYTWSGLSGVDNAAIGPDAMPPWSHRTWSRALLGSHREGIKARIWVRARNSGGADAAIYVDTGGGHVNGNPQYRHALTVPAGTMSPTWYSADIYVDEGVPLRAQIGYPLYSIRTRGVPPVAVDTSFNEAELLSISMWGI